MQRGPTCARLHPFPFQLFYLQVPVFPCEATANIDGPVQLPWQRTTDGDPGQACFIMAANEADEPNELSIAQGKLAELVGEHRRTSEYIGRKEYEGKMASLTLRELEGLSDATKIYKTMGKAFLLSSMPQIKDRVQSVANMAIAEKEKLREKNIRLEESIRASKERLSELCEKQGR